VRRYIVILCVLLVGGTAAYVWHSIPAPRPAATADDLTALRLQATDLQRAVETLARSPDPDPAALSDLAARLDALTRRLDQIEGRAP
jgi:soluble cytochrome b562